MQKYKNCQLNHEHRSTLTATELGIVVCLNCVQEDASRHDSLGTATLIRTNGRQWMDGWSCIIAEKHGCGSMSQRNYVSCCGLQSSLQMQWDAKTDESDVEEVISSVMSSGLAVRSAVASYSSRSTWTTWMFLTLSSILKNQRPKSTNLIKIVQKQKNMTDNSSDNS